MGKLFKGGHYSKGYIDQGNTAIKKGKLPVIFPAREGCKEWTRGYNRSPSCNWWWDKWSLAPATSPENFHKKNDKINTAQIHFDSWKAKGSEKNKAYFTNDGIKILYNITYETYKL